MSMTEYADGFCDPAWPPGTVKLAQLLGSDKKDAEIILQPRPTDNPNDPLASPHDVAVGLLLTGL